MDISIELTLTPLQDNFEPPIQEFIKALRVSEFRIIETPLSTQIYGDYDGLMAFLNKEIKQSLYAMNNGLLTMKIVKTDRSDYEPNF